mgnify:FL=1
MEWAARCDFTPTSEQIERGINDKSLKVVLAWLHRHDITWTEAQIERGLQHDNAKVRSSWEDILRRQNEQSHECHESIMASI